VPVLASTPLVNVVLRTTPGSVLDVPPISVESAESNCPGVELSVARSVSIDAATPVNASVTDTKMARPETVLRRVTEGVSVGSSVIKPILLVEFAIPATEITAAFEAVVATTVAAMRNDNNLIFIFVFLVCC